MSVPLGSLVDLEGQLSFEIRNAHLALQRDIAAAFRALDLTPEAFYVLCVLYRAPGQTPAALAKLVGVQPPNMHLLLKRLRSAGFVEDLPLKDRRSKALRLTERGEALRRSALTRWFTHCGHVDRQAGDRPHGELNSALRGLARLRPSPQN